MKSFFELLLNAKKVVINKIKDYKEYFTPRNYEEAQAAGGLISLGVFVFLCAFIFDILAYFF